MTLKDISDNYNLSNPIKIEKENNPERGIYHKPSRYSLANKGGQRPNNGGQDLLRHGYDEVYEPYFHRFRNNNINIAEIGILNGACLAIYSDYFNKGRVYGYDINVRNFNNNLKELKSRGCFTNNNLEEVKEMDSTVPEEVKEIKHNFDIIIDDADHQISSIISTFKNFYPKLKLNGIYIIEDVKTKYKKRLIKFLEKNKISFRFYKSKFCSDYVFVTENK